MAERTTEVRPWYQALIEGARIRLDAARIIARKELGATFGSPMALIFVGAFLIVTLFSFFWIETFFSRNIADVRPLFQWMPVLMIFLVAALTMRQWSEEQRGGTLEILLTLPVHRGSLVLGKFAAVLALVAVALGLTLFLPITVGILGDLDLGPVVGGYLAALLLASTYAAIGLFVSSRTDNQIVALIVTILLCGALYLVGTQTLTSLVGDWTGEILRAIGTGSRFESIERGVIDLRDLVYYLSVTALFLLLCTLSLEGKRWSRASRRGERAAVRRHAIVRVALVAANLVALNAWMFPVHALRLDLTAQREYSLSPVTKDLVSNLSEPLLMRGYFSEKTHPLLAPLVPTIRDVMREYAIASGGQIQVEAIDPRDNPELEEEANQVYGISPTPFRISGRYEDSVINSYLDILIRYGDQSITLGFEDLIEVEALPSGQVDVRLRNLEYDLTGAIKKAVYGFQSLDTVLASLESPARLTVLLTEETLPASLLPAAELVAEVAQELEAESDQFVYEVIDPDRDPSLTRQALYDTYGIQPFAASLFSTETYYLHLLLEVGDEVSVLYPGTDTSKADLRGEIEAALKRAAPGFLKTVGVWTPSEDPIQNPYTGQAMDPLSTWSYIRETLAQNYAVRTIDLTSGRVPGDIDVLLVIAPQGLTEVERYAVDQYLMRGGALVAAAGSYVLSPLQLSGLSVDPVQDSLADLLGSYGVQVQDSLVLDPQSEPFPVEVARQVGTMQVVEIQQVNYPFFVDVRSNRMASDSAIVSNLAAVTLQWASPLELDDAALEGRDVTVLLESSPSSWLRSELDVNPDLQTYPEWGFPVEGEQAARPLAVSVRGSFESFYRDQPSPLTEDQESTVGKIDVSPESARLVVIGSGEFLDDAVLNISRSLSQDRYLNNLQLVQNAVDWAVEDEDLLTIRSRGTYARLLNPLSQEQQSLWEGLNYAVALIGLVVLGVVWNTRRRNEEPLELVDPDEGAGEGGVKA